MDKLLIVWSSGEIEVAKKMVLLYSFTYGALYEKREFIFKAAIKHLAIYFFLAFFFVERFFGLLFPALSK